ncbi:membrane-bound lytic murein transglycosylase MltF [Bacterioplanoides sp. SCSIO 12839]|uniref:membrane-bound lytic murein transglycosylase MltF n=1 Tax=Bacterioplanoides sp. SCSIO 12839 TaxID=2829569 RepID=UPI002104B997|nr:membrane-bound lytic murein transglycosylase MltF [Bacterioplanoides sp. SCSIO 12839]UTW49348.1 membrane-bound lytic murein transglycosylase MltF [Bacterioplanoides sp. SCSIO 12839]
MPGSFGLVIKLLLSVMCVLALTGSVRPSNLQETLMRGDITMVSRNSPTTYYEDRSGVTGYEYELAKSFADYLGVELKVVLADSTADIFPMLDKGQAAFAAAGLTVTSERQRRAHFAPPYLTSSGQIIYRRGGLKPKAIADLSQGQLVVAAQSSHSQRLRALQANELPELTWSEGTDLEVSDLLQMVATGNIDFTVVDSNEFRMLQAYFPNLAIAFDITEKQNVAWAFEHSRDNSLHLAAEEFFNLPQTQAKLLRLSERFYGHLDQLNYVGAKRFLRQTEKKLDRYKKEFIEAGEQHQFDWRLLAAMGYQESHWNPRAKSFTGVRGLMMLTRNTAKELGIENRLDPKQSIEGGSRYLAKLRKRLGSEVQEPDRTWMAMAAYNVGYGHLRDARKLTQKMGGDPNLWHDVMETLPLLSLKRYYRETTHGYARGQEPVDYVQNIRRYYDVLVWQDEQHPVFPQEEESLMVSSSAVTVIPPLL